MYIYSNQVSLKLATADLREQPSHPYQTTIKASYSSLFEGG